MLDCVADLQADPDFDDTNFFLIDQLLACADAEPVATTRDAYCAVSPGDAVCGLPLERFVADVLPACIAEARETLLAGRCVLPATVRGLRFSPQLVELSRVVIDDVTGIASGSVAEQQLILSVGATGQAVTSAQEALERTDDDAFDVLTLLDVGTRRTFVFVTATYGDNLYGRAFIDGTALVVADVIDGDIGGCAVERRLEGSVCTTDESCGPGACLGVVADGETTLGEGRCIHTDDPTSQPTRGSSCLRDEECPRSEGLVCVRRGGDGVCDDAWLRRRFLVGDASIVGPTTILPFVVSGMAAVSLKTTVSMVISHPNPADLTVSIVHPDGGSSAILFEDPTAVGPEVVLSDILAPLSTDESINGTWRVLIEDAGVGGPSAAVFDVEVAIESWFD